MIWQLRQQSHKCFHAADIISVLGPVQCTEEKWINRSDPFLPARPWPLKGQGFVHGVAHQFVSRRHTFGCKIRHGGAIGTKAKIGKSIRNQPIALFRLIFEETSQPGFDMGHTKTSLRSGQRTRQRGCGIPVDKYPVGFYFVEYPRHGDEHSTRGYGVAPPAYTQVNIRCGQLQLIEESSGHGVIPVLTGMDNDVRCNPFESQVKRCKFYKLRSGPHDREDLKLTTR